MCAAWNTYESPQTRRLRSDAAAMEQLAAESSILRFKVTGKPSQRYLVEFRGRSLAREAGKVVIRERHEVEIKLGASYPRTMPEIRWITPIYHPNISEIGLVCLGGYGTHWVPSLHLDALCGMLWDMARYHNYDIRSPYNRDAALWASNQTAFAFPIDGRPLRDRRAALGRIESEGPAPPGPAALGAEADAPTVADPEPTKADDPGFELVEAGPGERRAEPEGIVILDMELDLRPDPARRRPAPPPPPPQDEVVFLD
jgi:ubiquitin-protein ligase